MKTFDESQMKRIASAVKLVERSAKGTQTRRRRHVTGSVSESAVALISLVGQYGTSVAIYKGWIVQFVSGAFDPTTSLVQSAFDATDRTGGDFNCIFLNPADLDGVGILDITGFPAYFFGIDTGMVDSIDGFPVYVIAAGFQIGDAC